jgi:hypothetical protein
LSFQDRGRKSPSLEIPHKDQEEELVGMSKNNVPEKLDLMAHNVQPNLTVNPNDLEDLDKQIAALEENLKEKQAKLKKV